MKKIYIQPKLNVVKIAATQMICTSVTLSTTNSIDNVDQFGSRGGSFWDDEE